MHILKLRCHSAQDFHTVYQAHEPPGALFCPTTREFKPDTRVLVELVCDGFPNRVLLRGTVVEWRRAIPRKRVRAGAVVRLPPEELDKKNFVVETMAGRRQPPPKRRHLRLPVTFPVKVRFDSDRSVVEGELRDISVSGARLVCPQKLAVGSSVVIELVPPGSLAPVGITSRVLYYTGDREMGVRFLYRDGGGSRRLREMVRRFKAG